MAEYHGTILECIAYLSKQTTGEYEIKDYHPKRSLKAHAYYWELVGKISEKMNLPKDEVHRRLLTDYGTFEKNEDGSAKWVILPKNKPLPTSMYLYDTQTDVVVKGAKSGEEMGRAYIVIKGSHLYDSKEMNGLLKGTVQEAEQLDIETRTPQEIELMIQQMRDKEQ